MASTGRPDVRYLDGEYVMYFDSMAQPSLYYDQQGTGFSHYAQCIGVATSTAPAGPFTGRSSPLICDFGAHGAIDPRTFLASDGDLYLDWKSDDNAAAPAAYAVSHLYAQRLSANGLSLDGPPHLLLTADERWQAKIVEAPDMVEARGKFWLFYSGSWFNSSNYGVGYASCAGPIGPCTDQSVHGPFIGSNSQGQGPGEESLFEDHKRAVVDVVLAVVLRVRPTGRAADRHRSHRLHDAPVRGALTSPVTCQAPEPKGRDDREDNGVGQRRREPQEAGGPEAAEEARLRALGARHEEVRSVWRPEFRPESDRRHPLDSPRPVARRHHVSGRTPRSARRSPTSCGCRRR